LVTEGELIESFEVLQRVASESGQGQAEIIADRLAWRELRRSDARCLRCGATEIVATPEGAQAFQHPGCGG
jgi:hypothetical protein